ncbi:hypothetical protein CAPTEDRAFT_209180 [Capitella teleta]|uniref:G-protein coupled receptors family 1 profile domain-containing protein n=1 Tax=Capitella teleta TaxID=283909 RepID=R7TIV7_CAPTE|nr:hypothetical protein CAPTEDRAFT_209180 [Capitella teleta]|eukprot:ELT91476.1 hypothetical protein CAPTEDRAFT_209180 [Capitella teleta]
MNTVAVYIILAKSKPLSMQNRLLLNLFLVNCTLCGIILPVHMVDLSQGIDNDWGFFCNILGSLINYGNCSGFIAYLHITLHRYFAVVFAQSKSIGYGSTLKTSLIVGICNLIPGIVMAPGLIGAWGKFGVEPSHGTCNLLEAQNGGSVTFNMFGQVVALGIPLITMIYCYGHIIYTVKRQRKKVPSHLSYAPFIRTKETLMVSGMK